MEKFTVELTEKELMVVLELREKERNTEEQTKEKNILKKYFFNKWTFIDVKVALIRETMRMIFALYIIQQLKK